MNDKSQSFTAAEVTEVKSVRYSYNRRDYQKGQGYSRQRDGKKAGGGTGGQRSHRPPQQNHSQTHSPDSNETTTTTQQQKITRGPAGGSEKAVKGEPSKKPKKVNAVPDSGSTPQEPTRSGASAKPSLVDRTLAEPMPSFKNLYSSSPIDEGTDFCPLTQDSWPSFLSQQSDLNLPPSQRPPHSPISPPITSVCAQSSSPHFSYIYPPTYSCDLNLMYSDIWTWTADSDAFTPTLHHMPSAASTEPTT